jgi:hypothetical protein
VFKERAKGGEEEVEVDKKQWRGSDEARRATGCICIVSGDGGPQTGRGTFVPCGVGVGRQWCGRDEGGKWAVGSGQWSVGSWWGRIHETRYRWVGVALAQQQQQH